MITVFAQHPTINLKERNSYEVIELSLSLFSLFAELGYHRYQK